MQRHAWLAVVVAALGYFVDLYDLVLFSILRVPSLKALGVAESDLASVGTLLLDLQLAGLFIGGLAWGVLGDRRGRLTVLFGSIVLYSLANLANAFVDSIALYGVCRVAAGLGLAGELGAGVTLVAESLPTRIRGIGTTIVAALGLSGAVAAGLVGEALLSHFGASGWRYAYGVGGIMGLCLLVLRVGVLESALFAKTRQSHASRGSLGLLFGHRRNAARMLRVVLVGMPIWFAGGVLFVFSPEIGGALGLSPKPTGGQTIFWAYSGVVVGDVLNGLLSQRLASRRRVIGGCLVSFAVCLGLFLGFGGKSLTTYYVLLAVVGASTGYWVIFLTTATEQFGTNLRATVTTSAPNFVRATAIPVTFVWLQVKPLMGVIPATLVVGLCCIGVGLAALVSMPESFANELDFVEGA